MYKKYNFMIKIIKYVKIHPGSEFMETLKFKLISNDKETINRSANYVLQNNIISFKIDNSLYKYNINENILIKTEDNNRITIDINKEIIIIELIKEKYMFDLIIKDVELIKNDNIIEIKYKVDEEDKIINHIIIEY